MATKKELADDLRADFGLEVDPEGYTHDVLESAATAESADAAREILGLPSGDQDADAGDPPGDEAPAQEAEAVVRVRLSKGSPVGTLVSSDGRKRYTRDAFADMPESDFERLRETYGLEAEE